MRLDEVTLNVTDGKHGDCIPEDNSGYYFISCKDIKGSRINYQGAREITKDEYLDVHRRTKLEIGDTLITNSGTIGRMCFVDSKAKIGFTTFQKSVAIVKPDKDKVLPEYLYFYLNRKVDELVRKAYGSSQKNLLLSELRGIVLELPDLDEQKIIVDSILPIHQKVLLNEDIISNLEEYSQLLFHKWFVDFNFPDENDNPYKDAGGEMVEIDGKMVPKGWETKPIDHLVSKTITGDWGKDEPEKELSSVRCIRGADLPNWRMGKTNTTPIRFVDISKQSEKALVHGDVMIEISGGSPTQSTGRILNIRSSVLNEIDTPVYCSNFSKIIRPKNTRDGLYLGLHLQKLYDRGVFFHFESKTTGLKNLLLPKVLKNLSIVVPSRVVLEIFNEIVEPCFDKINQLGTENQLLEQTRDLLIKKLIK